jgi:hypothetical protein
MPGPLFHHTTSHEAGPASSLPQVHERHLSTDFLLAVFKFILPKRPDLKIILMSATIDTERFSTYFDGGARVRVRVLCLLCVGGSVLCLCCGSSACGCDWLPRARFGRTRSMGSSGAARVSVLWARGSRVERGW